MNYKTPIKLRDMIIGLAVAVTLLIFGGLFDFQISSAIYNPSNPNIFGIIMSGVCELPVCFALIFGGSLLIRSMIKEQSKVKQVIFIIIAALAIIVGAYFIYDTWMDISKFPTTSQFDPKSEDYSSPLLIILGIVFTIAFTLAVLYVGLFSKKITATKETIFKVGLILVLICLAIAICTTGLKYLWGRPRPRYIFGFENPSELFHPFWQIDAFRAFKEEVGDNFKSFPSGHSTYAATLIFVLPYITKLNKNNDEYSKMNTILFYVGIAYTLVAMFSRMLAGAHFLSDTAMGMFITVLCGSIITYTTHLKKI